MVPCMEREQRVESSDDRKQERTGVLLASGRSEAAVLLLPSSSGYLCGKALYMQL